MSIVRVQKRESPYTTIEKTMSESPDLSWQAKGMLTYLFGKPDGWKIQVSDLTNHATNGRDANYAILNELIAAGYIKRTQLRDGKGRATGYEYVVYEEPQDAPNLAESKAPRAKSKSRAKLKSSPESRVGVEPDRFPDNPDTDSPFTASQDISNKEREVKNEKKEIADLVFLTDTEHRKLLDLLDEDLERYFLRYAAWISGKSPSFQRKRSAYLTISAWYKDDEAKKPARKSYELDLYDPNEDDDDYSYPPMKGIDPT